MHAIRIDSAKWDAALAKARSEGRTLTRVIDSWLDAYLGAAPSLPGPVPAAPRVRVPDAPDAPRDATGQPCPHPKPRVLKGLCGACGTNVS